MVPPKKAWLAVATLIGASALVLAGCSSSGTSGESATPSEPATTDPAAACVAGTPSTGPLQIATILPLTGNLAYLNPAAVAGSGLAVEDINAAGGVLDQDVIVDPVTDSGGGADMSVSTASAAEILGSDAQVVIGAESSGVTLNFVDSIVSDCRVQISPANTSTALSGYSSYYFRTAPPDSVQGPALANIILGDGNQKIAFLVFNDPYGTGLRDEIQTTLEDAGAEVVYGGTGEGSEFPPGQETFSSEVTAALATQPDAIVVLAFDETTKILPELAAQGWDLSKVYMSDGNTTSTYDLPPGTLLNAKGTIPGSFPDDQFRPRLVDYYQKNENGKLVDFSYAAESYDSVVLAALAAQAGGGTDGPTIQANMAAVSGADGGEECKDYAACLALLKENKAIHYVGKSAIGPLNDKNEPSTAFISLYQFDNANFPQWVSSVEMNVTYK